MATDAEFKGEDISPTKDGGLFFFILLLIS